MFGHKSSIMLGVTFASIEYMNLDTISLFLFDCIGYSGRGQNKDSNGLMVEMPIFNTLEKNLES